MVTTEQETKTTQIPTVEETLPDDEVIREIVELLCGSSSGPEHRKAYLENLRELAERDKAREAVDTADAQTPDQADVGSQDGDEDEKPTTGIPALDDYFYNYETDDVLAAIYAVLDISWQINELGDRILSVLRYQLKKYSSIPEIYNCKLSDSEPETIIKVAWWLAFLEGMDSGDHGGSIAERLRKVS